MAPKAITKISQTEASSQDFEIGYPVQGIATPFGLAMTEGRPVASATGQNNFFLELSNRN
jgi:hypothetical protein